MTRAKDVYYVATPKKHVNETPPDCYEDTCLQCHETVLITNKMKPIAKQAKGIICVPDAMELTNMTVPEMMDKNAVGMTEILDKEIAKMQKRKSKR